MPSAAKPEAPAHLDVALVQSEVHPDVGRNERLISETIRETGDADLIVFPEYALSGRSLLDAAADAEALAADIARGFQAIRRVQSQTRAAVVLPTLFHHADKRWTNSAFWLVPGGNVLARHDKSVLTPVEQRRLAAGTAPTLVRYSGVTFGIALCLEGNGSEVVAYLSMGGASVVIQPSYPEGATTPWPDGSVDPWTVNAAALFPLRLRVRALADQVTMIWATAAKLGSRSRIISPFGEQVAAATSDEPQLVRAKLDLTSFPFRDSSVFRQRQQLPPRPGSR